MLNAKNLVRSWRRIDPKAVLAVVRDSAETADAKAKVDKAKVDRAKVDKVKVARVVRADRGVKARVDREWVVQATLIPKQCASIEKRWTEPSLRFSTRIKLNGYDNSKFKWQAQVLSLSQRFNASLELPKRKLQSWTSSESSSDRKVRDVVAKVDLDKAGKVNDSVTTDLARVAKVDLVDLAWADRE